MKLAEGKGERPQTDGGRDLQEERFRVYFPRVFAYACSVAGSDEAAQDIVVTAFANALAQPGLEGPGFELALFRAARDAADHGGHHGDGLNAEERDVIALVFDAQLQPAQVAELMGEGEATVSILLARGLRKLQSRFAPDPAPDVSVASYR
jgi:DNA-directed RNA polymerase specialized sigma24 family protein